MTLDLKDKKVLIISPHPDDEVIGCGGLIAKCKKLNSDVKVVYMCTGESRQLVSGSTDSDSRVNEINQVSSYGNFKYQIIFENKYFVELDSIPQKKIVDPIEDIIEEFKPSIMLIPHGESYNQDHRATFTACITALRPIPSNLRHFVDTVLIYEEPYAWTIKDMFKPNIYLNTEDIEDEKVKLMMLHKSQDRPFPFARSGENLIARMRIRGSEVGLKSAEAYTILRGSMK
tara:strand:+ start:805 stop:1494 length:690 start_codon:yes stop_codon:yes gene_type:complete